MFTGIVEETGVISAFARRAEGGWRMRVAAGMVLPGLRLGDSVAVNGCCLTAVQIDPAPAGSPAARGEIGFDVLDETRRLTCFASLDAGAPVNLERSLPVDGRLGGHFVSGHVDGTGRIEVIEPRGNDHYLGIQAPGGSGRYLVHKGSVAVDGISLTVAWVEEDRFAVWLIPHTLAATNLFSRRAGDSVNLEFDLLAKYIEKLACVPPSTP